MRLPKRLTPWLPLLFGGMLTVLLLLIGEYGLQLQRNWGALEKRNQITNVVGQYRATLEGELNATLFLTNGAMAFVQSQETLEPKALTATLQALYAQGHHVRNIGIAPDNRLTYVYPLRGNEKAIGLYYPDEPLQWRSVSRAMQEKRPVLAGPLKLKQGGNGIVYRVPVFRHTDGRYWGVVSMVLDADHLFAKVGIAPEVNGLEMALRGKDGLGAQGDVFLGNASLFEQDAVTAEIQTPGGDWLLAVRPVGGWIDGEQLGGWRAVIWSAALFLGWVLFQMLSALRRQRKAERALRRSESKLRGLFELSPVGFALVNQEGFFLEFNTALEQICGYGEGELKTLTYSQITPPEYAHEENRQLKLLADTGYFGPYEKEFICKDGHRVPVRLRGMLVERPDGPPDIWSIVEDVSHWKAIENTLREQKDMLTVILENSSVGMAFNRVDDMVWVNGRMCEIFGYTSDEFRSVAVQSLFFSDEDFEAFRKTTLETMLRGQRYAVEREMRCKNGTRSWLRITGQSVHAGEPANGIIWIAEDISAQKHTESELRRLATTDGLTSLANRRSFIDQLEKEIARVRRFKSRASLLMVDIDHFKKINDTYGHAVGDAVLKRFAAFCLQKMRHIDVVGRLGGEEFALLLPETDEAGALLFAQRFVKFVATETLSELQGEGFTVSIGVTQIRAEDVVPDEVLARADRALYEAKSGGRNTVRVA
jgi:diguanylate cyclase (GGDEF)-like protein/PAS domain S-box-containing protein